jgi:hypothetical protein
MILTREAILPVSYVGKDEIDNEKETSSQADWKLVQSVKWVRSKDGSGVWLAETNFPTHFLMWSQLCGIRVGPTALKTKQGNLASIKCKTLDNIISNNVHSPRIAACQEFSFALLSWQMLWGHSHSSKQRKQELLVLASVAKGSFQCWDVHRSLGIFFFP